MPDGQFPVDYHWTGEAEPRTLKGGPRDGVTVLLPPHLKFSVPVVCPSCGDHIISVVYDVDGTCAEIRCPKREGTG